MTHAWRRGNPAPYFFAVAKRSYITPDFFSVAPELLGLPLATPSRRAMAMAVDGALVAILVQSGGLFLGLTAVFILLRASGRNQQGGFIRRNVRLGLRVFAAMLLLLVILKAWNFGEEKIHEVDDGRAEMRAENVDGNLTLDFPPGEALGVVAAARGLATADEPNEVSSNAEKILSASKRAGATPSQLRAARGELIDLMDDDADSASVAALDSAIARVAGAAPTNVSRQDSLRIQIDELSQRISKLDSANDKLEADLKNARENRGVRSYIGGVFDDLGLGFGWAAVYFTGFLAMMRGQTPGKRLMGLRVIRLDGKPLGWWISFERFGGYAASFSVGLLGFLQILWDRNRQGLHDKACETVVVRENQPKAMPLNA
jgi:hypothetical protein